MIDSQVRHAMLPLQTHDELARQNFARSLKRVIFDHVTPGVTDVYERRVLPAFKAKEGREPVDRHEIRRVMMQDPYVKLWSSLRRVSQEILWDSVTDNVERQADQLAKRAKLLPGAATLTLDASVQVPRYVSAIDIHLMPTGYWTDTRDDDVAAGAIYDRGVYLYASGQLGGLNDDYGRTIVENFLKVERPDWHPARILEIGCTCGGSLIPFVDAYAEAEVHGIDIGAPVLRYAVARTNALGRIAHFHQMSGEEMKFSNDHFDVVFSAILIHETAHSALRRILAESYRVLAPGGLMVHGDFPQYAATGPFTQFMLDWDTYNNNEPFWGALHDTDLLSVAISAGFEPSKVRMVHVPAGRKLQSGVQGGGGGRLSLLVAEK